VEEYMREVAERLGERASLRTVVVDGEVEFELVPTESAAVSVSVSVDPTDSDGELWFTVAGEGEPGDLPWLQKVVHAAISGDITLLEGRGRRRLEIAIGDGEVRSSTSYGSGFVPLPWRHKARRTRFAPY